MSPSSYLQFGAGTDLKPSGALSDPRSKIVLWIERRFSKFFVFPASFRFGMVGDAANFILGSAAPDAHLCLAQLVNGSRRYG
jgi:hypothetical protein